MSRLIRQFAGQLSETTVHLKIGFLFYFSLAKGVRFEMSWKVNLYVLVVAMTVASCLRAQTSYSVVDLGTLVAGSTTSRGMGINGAGGIVFSYDTMHQWGLLATFHDEELLILPTNGNRYATGLDNAGNVVGGFAGRALGWYFGALGYQVIPEPIWETPLYFWAESRALAMNDWGGFTGAISLEAPAGSPIPYLSQSEAYLAVVLPSGSLSVQRLGMVDGLSTVGWGLNVSGDVVGSAGPATNSVPVLFRNGVSEILPSLGGPLNRAYSVNDAGLVVGFVSSSTQAGGFYAGSGAVWDVSIPNQPLLMSVGQLGDSNHTQLFSVNNQGVAVGMATQFEASVALWQEPIRWTASEGIVRIQQLLPTDSPWVITDVRGINHEGKIVGTGRLSGGLPTAIRLDPIVTTPRLEVRQQVLQKWLRN